jgi:hypothetical protein
MVYRGQQSVRHAVQPDEKPMLVTCPCSHCGGRIQFAEEYFREMGTGPDSPTGQTIPCPHCGAKTTLFLPRKTPPPSVQGQVMSANKLKRRQFYFLGLVLLLTGAAVAVIGAMGLVVTVKAAFFHGGSNVLHNPDSALTPIYSLGTFLCIAAIGIGLCTIGRWVMWTVVCSNCRNPLAAKESAICPCCGATLEK